MSIAEGEYQETFTTEAAALAFTEGLEWADSDHISWEPPYEDAGQWIVDLKVFA